MRRLSRLLLIALALTSSVAAAHDEVIATDPLPRRNALLINPGDLFNGTLSMEYERGVVPWLGINFGFGVSFFPSMWNADDANTAVNLELGFRFHFIRHAPGGLWFGPYALLRAGFDEDHAQWLTWGLGAAVGYNFVLGRHFTLQLGGGGGFIDHGDHVAWAPRFRLGIGASW
jgi:hypothetical protein